MPSLLSKQKRFAVILLALTALPAVSPARETTSLPGVRISPRDHPAAETLFVPSFDTLPQVSIEPSWLVKAGAKKKLSGRAVTEQERFIAPDTAVLDRGFSAAWPLILSGHKEASVPAGPEDIAELTGSKSLLIIPSGALAGTAGSGFFKTGLAEYVRSGGTVFCLAQGRGADFSALPFPEGQQLTAAGWSEDAGPLFRGSKVRTSHPLLVGLTKPAPGLETDGYFTAYPAGSQVLLSRADGFPTLIVYPLGKGWVVAGTLFTDFLSLLGNREPDEITLIRNLVAWSKDPGRPRASSGLFAGQAVVPPVKTEKPARILLPIRAVAERRNKFLRLSLTIPPDPRFLKQSLFVRTGGQKKKLVVSRAPQKIFFELPLAGAESRVSYAVYNGSWRAISRGSLTVPPVRETGIALDRPYYFPGEKATIRFGGIGNVEASVEGLGFLNNRIIADKGSIHLEMPHDLPAGTYRMDWRLEDMNDKTRQGELPIDLCGYRVAFENASVETKQTNGQVAASAGFTIRSTKKVSGLLRLQVRGPEGKIFPVSDQSVTLLQGPQTIPVSFSFAPAAAGIWELLYTLLTTLPQGAGIPPEPVTLASGSTLFDVGNGSVLAVLRDKNFYYEPSGPVAVTAVVAGKGKAKLEVYLNEKRVQRDRVVLNGLHRYSISLPEPGPGTHTVRVVLSGKDFSNARNHTFVYGLGLPDLNISISAVEPRSGPDGPSMPLTAEITNKGKSRSEACSAALYEGNPAKRGDLIAKLAVPSLNPGERHRAALNWLLYRKAGNRTVFSAVDAEKTVTESNENNNQALLDVNVPELLLTVTAGKKAFGPGEPVSLPVSAFNLTTRSHKDLSLDVQISDPYKRTVYQEKIPVDKIAPGAEKKVAFPFKLVSLPVGTYDFSAGLYKNAQLSGVKTQFVSLPGLLLTASLDGTPAQTALCSPLVVRYSITNQGNITPSSGTVRLDIVPERSTKALYSKQFPLAFTESSVAVDTAAFHRDAYTVRLSAYVQNSRYGMSREFNLAEQRLEVMLPFTVKRATASFPRVLIWIGRESRVLEQAVSETIVKQAFEQEDVYYKIADSEEDFTVQTRTGIFDTYILFEPGELHETPDWLDDRLERGQGVVIIGAQEPAVTLARKFGVALKEAPPETSMLTFAPDSGLDLSGNVPVSGKMFSPRKRGARIAASYAPGNLPAALIDETRKGKLLLMPFSPAGSAVKDGTHALYGLILRKAAFFAAPRTDEAGEIVAGALTVSSRDSPVDAKITETLPPGSKIFWTSGKGVVEGNSIFYEFQADKEPRRLLYLYRTGKAGQTPVMKTDFGCKSGPESRRKAE